MLSGSLDVVLRNPRIPTLPKVATQVLHLTREPDVDLQKIAEIVQNDQALAVKIVRTVNSSYYKLSHPCATVNQAIVYLGIRAVKPLILGFSLVESIDGASDRDVGFDYTEYWRRALYSAAASRELATAIGDDDSERVFLAALIQDIGMVALYRTYGDVYLQVIDLTKGDHSALVHHEQRALQIDHTIVGAALAERWNLPQQLMHAIRCHHSPEHTSDEGSTCTLTRCVQLGTALAGTAAVGEVPTGVYDRALEWFGIRTHDLDKLIQKLGRAVAELSALFQVDTCEYRDHQEILAEAEDVRVAHEVGLVQEIEELSAQESPQAAASQEDELLTQITRCFNEAKRSRSNMALLLLKVDLYREVEAVDGAQAADAAADHLEALITTALADDRATLSRLPEGRIGLVLPSTNRRQATRKAESLRRLIESEPLVIATQDESDRELRLAVSIGVAALEPAFHNVVGSAAAMFEIAEQALHAACEAGGNCVRVFSPRRSSAA